MTEQLPPRLHNNTAKANVVGRVYVAEMYGLLKDLCEFNPRTQAHEIAALQSKAQMLLDEIKENAE